MLLASVTRMGRGSQDREHLNHLKAGLDRGGEPRTWQEVGELAGVTAAYARRVANGKLSHPPAVVWIDPRDIIPQFADLLSDGDVLEWNDDPRCLCGCGETTLQERGNTGKVPYGAFRLFRGGHEKRMPWVSIPFRDRNREPERARRIGLARRARNVKAGMIADQLNEWKAITGVRTFDTLAASVGLAPNHVRDIAGGRLERIEKKTAGRILAALGEPMRPEIFAAFQEWALRQGRSCEDIQVIT